MERGRKLLVVATMALAALCQPDQAPAGEVLLESFEQPGSVRSQGPVSPASGADVVTEGKAALQLGQGGLVNIAVPAGAAAPVGWLKIDTFVAQPVLGAVRLAMAGWSTRGFVKPGKDTLCLPLCMIARGQTERWPDRPTTLTIYNEGPEKVVIDNIRLVPPAAAPPGMICLDFGPDDQAIWPGFTKADNDANIAWSGNERTYSFAHAYPDPLTGDFTGLMPAYKTHELLSLRNAGKANCQAWAWLPHFGSSASPAVEFQVKLNGTSLAQRRLQPAQILSPEGLLEGKDQPWTNAWFETAFVPQVVSKVEMTLKPGFNQFEFNNAQIAALVIAPAGPAAAAREWVKQLEEDLKIYRRQFVLAKQEKPLCQAAVTDEQTRAGLMLAAPPENEWFNRQYAAPAEHIGQPMRLAVATGATGLTAFVAVPLADAAGLQAAVENLDSSKGTLPAAAIRVQAIESMPLIRNGAVHYQPFLCAPRHRAAGARNVCWFAVQVTPGDRQAPGLYKGSVRVSLGQQSAAIPLEVEVVRVPGTTGLSPVTAADETPTFGTLSTGDCGEIYRSTRQAIAPAMQLQVTRDILAKAFAGGLNAAVVNGPGMAPDLKVDGGYMSQLLAAYPRAPRPGKTLVQMDANLRHLRSTPIQFGTNRYMDIVRDLVKVSTETMVKSGVSNWTLATTAEWSPQDATDLPKLLPEMSVAGGRLAMRVFGSGLNSLQAAQRGNLFRMLDTVACIPDVPGLAALQDEFRKAGQNKTFLLLIAQPTMLSCGLYSWATGADGFYTAYLFPGAPAYNPFWFDPRPLMLPNAQGGGERTLSFLMLNQGAEDFMLAHRCEALVRAAKTKTADVEALEQALADIRAKLQDPPGFDAETWRTTRAAPQQITAWRETLMKAAAKLAP